MYIPEKGDIIHLRFDPASGKEMKGDHFALVISPKAFNKATGLVFACPISQGNAVAARGMLSTLLGSGTHTRQYSLSPAEIFGLERTQSGA